MFFIYSKGIINLSLVEWFGILNTENQKVLRFEMCSGECTNIRASFSELKEVMTLIESCIVHGNPCCKSLEV